MSTKKRSAAAVDETAAPATNETVTLEKVENNLARVSTLLISLFDYLLFLLRQIVLKYIQSFSLFTIVVYLYLSYFHFFYRVVKLNSVESVVLLIV